MAKTKSKSKDGGMQVRRITNKKERKSGNLFQRLSTDEWMKGYALFTPDPEADKNPFWFEYLEHYDKPNNQYVPCTGDDCYMCELGDNPSPRAMTLWYFPDNPEKERFKAFKMNGYLIRDFTEIEEEEGGVLGRRFRVKRLSDKGEYRATPQSDKALTKKEISALIKEAQEMGIDFEKLILAQAKSALSKVSAADALTDVDDDDDEEETKKTKGGNKKSDSKSNSKKKDDDDEDDDDDDDDDEDEDEDEDDDEDDDEDSDDDDSDDDDEDDDSDDDDDDDDEDEDEESDDDEDEESDDDDDDEEEELKKQSVTVTSTSEKDDTITGKLDNKGKATKLYVGEGLDVDWDKVKKGVEITVDAKKDDEDDWVLTKVAVKKKK